jgi:UDP-N-acetyl-D-glucosamine dehydrogenase
VQVAEQLAAKIKARDARVGILGLGYVGLPLSVEFASAGLAVTGLDLDRQKVDAVNAGRSYIKDVEADRLSGLVASGRLRASANLDDLASCDAVIICVPTPLSKTKDPDLTMVVDAAKAIASRLRTGQLVVLESTTYPGTTEELIQPLLEEGGLRAGESFFLAFSPERVDPGNARFNTRNTPKIIGGCTPACAEVAGALYRHAVETVIPVSSPRAAEMVKLLENTFRSVNIGLVNEVALMCARLGVDVWEVIDAAATKPFGFLPFYPGPGLGGHCIPIDPFYLSWKMRTLHTKARFIELAGEVNHEMPEFIVAKVVNGLNDERKSVRGAKVCILGFAYKRDVSDVRESPAFDIATKLRARGAEVSYHDPHAPEVTLDWGKLRSTALTADFCRKLDCAVIVTDHAAMDLATVLEHCPLVVDSRNATKGKPAKARILKL